ncbi:hypothetical protein RUMCAL_00609 [Ruminococcus callidus ATCC 27760]|uniref:Uncharacterized protein n=1 Tax=Ruminococcus callidus ATCC 27760 TaxID=411473 RepID=U2KES0_9FIRM|nr:hypothetical protein RUMCAL_00609 [Ruminococcus callidus ATCC 27760]
MCVSNDAGMFPRDLLSNQIKETLHKARLTALHAICVQIFPSYCPEIPCHNNGSLPAEFLSNLPKNLTTHLTHKLYSVFP